MKPVDARLTSSVSVGAVVHRVQSHHFYCTLQTNGKNNCSARSIPDSSSTKACTCASRWIRYHAGHQEVSRCCTRGDSEESTARRWWSMQVRGPILAFENQNRYYQKYKNRGISGHTKRTDALQIFFLKAKDKQDSLSLWGTWVLRDLLDIFRHIHF